MKTANQQMPNYKNAVSYLYKQEKSEISHNYYFINTSLFIWSGSLTERGRPDELSKTLQATEKRLKKQA